MRIVKFHDDNTLRIRRKLTVFPTMKKDGIHVFRFDWIAETFNRPEYIDHYLLFMWDFALDVSKKDGGVLKTINDEYGPVTLDNFSHTVSCNNEQASSEDLGMALEWLLAQLRGME